jgi:hypothetical protein
MRASALGFAAIVLAVLSGGCADESTGSASSEMPGQGGGPSSPNTSSAGAVAHAWCKKNAFAGYPVTDGFNDLWAENQDNVWLTANFRHVGFYPSGAGSLGIDGTYQFLLHWNGQEMCQVSIQDLISAGTSTPWVYAIGGAAPDDLWVAVTNGILHWDGRTWTKTGETAFGSQFLAFAPNDVFSRGSASLYHWDGVAWTESRVNGLNGRAVLGSCG